MINDEKLTQSRIQSDPRTGILLYLQKINADTAPSVEE